MIARGWRWEHGRIIFDAMSWFPSPASPRILWQDLRAFATERTRYQWIGAFFAILMPVVIIAGFAHDAKYGILPPEQVIYVENWREGRTDEEIKAAQKIHQEQREEMRAERQRQFQRLENRLGI